MKLKSRQQFRLSILIIPFLMSVGVGLTTPAYARKALDQKAPIIASLSNFDTRMKSVTLDNQGQLTVVLHGQGDMIIQTVDVLTTDRLAELSKTLSKSEIVTDIHHILCMVVPDIRTLYTLKVGNYSVNTDLFQDGPMKTILTPSDCSVPSYTHPRDKKSRYNANILKNALRKLAEDSIDSDEVGC